MDKYKASNGKYDSLHHKRLTAIEKRIQAIYEQAIKEVAQLGTKVKELKDKENILNLDHYPDIKKKVDSLMQEIGKGVESTVVDGIVAEWELANGKNDTLARLALGKKLDTMSDKQMSRYFSTNSKALEAFIQRKEKGLNLSERVWKYTNTFRNEIEMALDLGIRSGKGASAMARDLKDYLQNPNKLFRRVRNEHGQLKLSRAAKAYHPGRGVYRSSYMNARRLATTETNMAYRTADHLRHGQLDFIVGIKICLSNNHNCKGVPRGMFFDICDELKGKYPKDFNFTGWHPHCRCHVETIIKTEEELEADTERILNGEETTTESVNKVSEMPDNFRKWAENNKDRILTADNIGTTPYFIRDNASKVENLLQARLKNTEPAIIMEESRTNEIKDNRELIMQRAEERHKARTKEEAEQIQQEWNNKLERDKNTRKDAETLFKEMQDFKIDIDSKKWAEMEQAIKTGNLTVMGRMGKTLQTEVKDLQKRLKDLSKEKIIVSVSTFHKEVPIAEMERIQKSMKNTLSDWKAKGNGDFSMDLDMDNLNRLRDNLHKQAKLAENSKDNNPTWKMEQKSWTKLADKAQKLIDLQPAKAALQELEQIKEKSSEITKIISNLKAEIKANNVAGATQ